MLLTSSGFMQMRFAGSFFAPIFWHLREIPLTGTPVVAPCTLFRKASVLEGTGKVQK